MDPPPPPPPHPNNDDDPNRNDDQAQNEAHGLHGVSPLNESFSLFQNQVQLGHESAPPVVEQQPAQVEVPSTVSSNPGLSENVRPESVAIGSVESTVPCSDTSVPGTVESTETIAKNQGNPTEEVQVNPPVEVEQQPPPPVDVEVKDANNPQAKFVPADPADGETLSSQEGIRSFSSPGRVYALGRGNSLQRSNASVEKTLEEEHLKELEEKRKPLQALKTEERKVQPPIKIMELRPWTTGATLIVKVVGTEEFLSKGIVECLVGDETGMIIFTARNYQVSLMKEGGTVSLRNAKVVMFRKPEGFSMRLVVDRSGRVKVSRPANFTVKTDSNLSLIEFLRLDV